MTIRRSVPLLALALTGLLSAILLPGCARQPAPPESVPQPVTAVTLQPESVTLSRELAGRVHPFLVAEVRPQISGIVRDRLFAEGGRVEAGQPLYQIDDATYRAERDSARAALARAEATLESSRLNARRIEELVGRNAVSRQDNDNAVAALRQAEADVRAARAALQSREILVEYARIVSPISGTIGKSSVTQGALVAANQPEALATVQQLDPIYVDLRWSSRELLELRRELAAGTLAETKDLPVTILLEDGSRYPLAGRIAFADLTVDPGTGSFSMRVEVPNPEGLLLPGAYVRALVSSGERTHALLVPQQGVIRDAKGATSVLVVGADDQVERRVIEVGGTVGNHWLVDAGLVPGDRVIVAGLQKIQPGAAVEVVEAPPSRPADPIAAAVSVFGGSAAGK